MRDCLGAATRLRAPVEPGGEVAAPGPAGERAYGRAVPVPRSRGRLTPRDLERPGDTVRGGRVERQLFAEGATEPVQGLPVRAPGGHVQAVPAEEQPDRGPEGRAGRFAGR